MKKLFIIVLVCLIFQWAFWYELSPEDNQKLINAKSKLWLSKYEKDINWYYEVKKDLQESIDTSSDEKSLYFFTQLKDEVWYIIDSYKPHNYDEIKYEEEVVEQKDTSDFKQSFFQQHGKNIVWDLKVKENCVKHYDFVDQIAKKNNFPTALIISIWRKESNCWLFNPYNGWWPFQITSQYHNPWEITLDEMWEKIQNYIDFSKGKIAYFNSNKTYQERFGNEKIDFTYDAYTLKDIQLYAILYNWIWKTTDYVTNKFANGNLNTWVKSETDGIATLFLKITNWQLENNK